MSNHVPFIDNPAATDKFTSVIIDIARTMHSWRLSILSHEWLTAEGTMKPFDRLSDHQQRQYITASDAIKAGSPLTKPILGIGIMDNIEIGSERGTFVTLMSHGIKTCHVHIPKSNLDEFQSFIAS